MLSSRYWKRDIQKSRKFISWCQGFAKKSEILGILRSAKSEISSIFVNEETFQSLVANLREGSQKVGNIKEMLHKVGKPWIPLLQHLGLLGNK